MTGCEKMQKYGFSIIRHLKSKFIKKTGFVNALSIGIGVPLDADSHDEEN